MFERLRAALDAALAAAGEPGDLSKMREAVIEARAAVAHMREALGPTEGELALERRQLADAERRGRLAAEIGDAETVAVAQRFAARHAERAGVLERKLQAQRDELALAEREVSEMTEQLRIRERDRASRDASGRVRSVQNEMRAAMEAGAPSARAEDEALKSRLDRAAREAAAARQLEALKKKMGK